eukprot:gene365-779_t
MMKFSSSFMALSAIHVMNGLRDGLHKNVGDHPEINSNTKKKYITGKEVAIVTNRHDKQTSKEHMEDDPYGNMKNNRAYDSNNKPMPLSISNNNIAGDNKMKRRYSIDKNYDFTSFVQSESMGNISPAPRDKKGMLNYKLFFRAAEDGDIATLQSFLNEDADINMTRGRSGETALHLAVAEDDDHTINVVTFLLDKGIDTSLKNKKGETALQIAEREGFEDIANVIKKYKNGKLDYKLFFRAAEDGDINALQAFLQQGASINMTKGKTGNTALHLVVAEEDDHTMDVVKFLFEKGIDAGLENEDGETALQIAEDEGFDDIADLIKKHTNYMSEAWSCVQEDSAGVLHFDSSRYDSKPESSSQNTGSDENDGESSKVSVMSYQRKEIRAKLELSQSPTGKQPQKLNQNKEGEFSETQSTWRLRADGAWSIGDSSLSVQKVVVKASQGYPSDEIDGILASDTLVVNGVIPDSWADKHTDLGKYVDCQIIKINDVDVTNQYNANDVLSNLAPSETVEFTLMQYTSDSHVVGPYELIRVLGTGSFGIVHEVKCLSGDMEGKRVEGQTYALKNIQIQNERQRKETEKEASILNELNHDNIITLVDAFITHEDVCCLVMELANYGDLSNLIRERKKQNGQSWPTSFILDALEQIISGLGHAHAQNTMHRDLKPANVLVHALVDSFSKDWELADGAIQLKLSDFGLARVMDTSKDYASTQCGTRIPRIPKKSSSGEDWSQLRNLCIRMLDRETPKSRPSCQQILQHLIEIDSGTYEFVHEDLPSYEDLSLDECVEHIIVLASANDLPDKYDRMILLFEAIESHLTNEDTQKDVTDRLSKTAWVPAEVGQDTGEPVWLPFDRVAKDIPQAVMPKMGRLWFSVRSCKLFNQIPQHAPPTVLMTLMKSDNCKNVDFCLAAAKEIAECIRRLNKEEKPDEINTFVNHIRVPTRTNSLESTSKVCFVDYDDSKCPHTIPLVNNNISHADAKVLGCQSLRMVMSEDTEVDESELVEDTEVDESELVEEPFGQEEDLTHRIAQLCMDLELSDVFQEFFQNADDFGANDMLFLLDDTSYPDDNIVDQRAKILQGRSLIIASNKTLGPNDIRRIAQLSNSRKKMDYTAAGRFGIGMNAMYQMSDCPQLLANGHLHFFDLQRKFVTKDKPGQPRGKVYNKSKLEEWFPDSLVPFHSLDTNKWPVIFRLPLRAETGKFGQACDLDIAMLQKVADARKCLLFSRNVSSVSVLVRNSQYKTGDPSTKYSAQKKFTENKHSNGQVSVSPTLPDSQDKVYALQDKPQISVQTFDMQIHRGDQVENERWVVTHAFVLDDNGKKLHDHFREQGLALLPEGAVAHRIEPCVGSDGESFQASLHCHFLVQELSSAIPYSVHAPMHLTSNRKHIYQYNPEEEDTYSVQKIEKQQWNDFLLEGPVCMAISRLIEFEQDRLNLDPTYLKRYMGLFPSKVDEADVIGTAFYEGVFQRVRSIGQLFPVVKYQNRRPIFVRWPGDKGYFLPSEERILVNKHIHSQIVEDGLDIIQVPEDYDVTGEYEPINDRAVLDFLKTKSGELAQTIKQNGHGIVLADMPFTCLQKKKNVLDLLKFCLAQMQQRNGNDLETSYKSLEGVPLLLLHGEPPRVSIFGEQVFRFRHDVVRSSAGFPFVDADCLKLLEAPESAPSLESLNIIPLKK